MTEMNIETRSHYFK